MRTADFDYPLPAHLIAQTPAEPRDSARLMVLHRDAQSPLTPRIEHRRFRDIVDYLRPGDVLVANDTRVLHAQVRGVRVDTGQQIELLLIESRTAASGDDRARWLALGKPVRRLSPGAPLDLGGRVRAEVEERTPTGEIVVRFEATEAELAEALAALGEVPLPPYIHRAVEDPARYQTVYARRPGAAAAPTAGLHFTPELLARLEAMGVERAFVTLHTGLFTFRSVLSERVEDHHIHREWFELAPETAEQLNRARAEGRRIVAVGTTTVRVLETVGALAETPPDSGPEREGALLRPYQGWSRLFITPGFRFRVVDALITNFHMSRTTLMMLVSAFASREAIMAAYAEAIREGYRFYSFGDAMLIL